MKNLENFTIDIFDPTTIAIVVAILVATWAVYRLIKTLIEEEMGQTFTQRHMEEGQRERLGRSVLGPDYYINFTGPHGRINLYEKEIDHSDLEIKPTPMYGCGTDYRAQHPKPEELPERIEHQIEKAIIKEYPGIEEVPVNLVPEAPKPQRRF